MAWPTDYDGWIGLVRSWLDIEDHVTVTNDVIDTFLAASAVALNRDLNSQYAEEGPVEYVFTGDEPWPVSILDLGVENYNKLHLVSIQGGGPLLGLALNEMITRASQNITGAPSWYTIFGQKLYILPRPSADSVLHLWYYRMVEPVSQINFYDNAFAVYHPDALLYGALVAAEPYLSEDERLPVWKAQYDNIVFAINGVAKTADLGATPLRRSFNVYRS
jgi:hypothetical protein